LCTQQAVLTCSGKYPLQSPEGCKTMPAHRGPEKIL